MHQTTSLLITQNNKRISRWVHYRTEQTEFINEADFTLEFTE